MKDNDSPLKEFQKFWNMHISEPTTNDPSNLVYKNTIFVEPNELTDHTDPVGLFDKEYEPRQFLIPRSDEESFKVLDSQNDNRARYSDRPDVALPHSRT